MKDMVIGTVKAVCISEKKGTQKTVIESGRLLENWGLENDSHGGDWHRQISLISYEKIKNFNASGAEVDFGDFGENIIVSGIDFSSLPVGTRLWVNEAVLEITQIGKHCHTHCQIYHKMGDCIMPREGVFARVIKPGNISEGDVMGVEKAEENRAYTAAVITISDSAHNGKREDISGSVTKAILENAGYNVVEQVIIPDEKEEIVDELVNFADRRRVSLIVTTGGTGFSKRDVTPEATLEVAQRNAPGVGEAMRANSMLVAPRAMLSRGVCVIRGESVILNLPGSPKAVKENLEFILPHIGHGLDILLARDENCGE